MFTSARNPVRTLLSGINIEHLSSEQLDVMFNCLDSVEMDVINAFEVVSRLMLNLANATDSPTSADDMASIAGLMMFLNDLQASAQNTRISTENQISLMKASKVRAA